MKNEELIIKKEEQNPLITKNQQLTTNNLKTNS